MFFECSNEVSKCFPSTKFLFHPSAFEIFYSYLKKAIRNRGSVVTQLTSIISNLKMTVKFVENIKDDIGLFRRNIY